MKYWLFGLLVLGFSFIPKVFAADETGVVSLTPTPTAIPDYSLPYPGILPNNPLYSLKMARDKIILFLITDPNKKAQFNLLQADKRMEAAVFLINKDKQNGKLAVMTIEKGENYYHDAVQETTILQKEGHDVHELLLNLDHAATKHIILMTNLQKVIPQQSQELAQLKARMQSYQLQVTQAEH